MDSGSLKDLWQIAATGIMCNISTFQNLAIQKIIPSHLSYRGWMVEWY